MKHQTLGNRDELAVEVEILVEGPAETVRELSPRQTGIADSARPAPTPRLIEGKQLERLQAVAESVLRAEGVSGQATIVITGDDEIRQLNRDYLGFDAPTDVLAFSAQEEAPGFVSAPEAFHYLGDVIVSYPRAMAQAQEASHPVERELYLLVIHGLLHLLGYDHVEEEDQARMWARQDWLLSNATRPGEQAEL